MTNPMIRIHNAETNEIIDREMTDEEFSDYKKATEARSAELAQNKAQATAKAALLERLGITADEAALLLG
jgi:AmiR/NasT family two-component response regulator